MPAATRAPHGPAPPPPARLGAPALVARARPVVAAPPRPPSPRWRAARPPRRAVQPRRLGLPPAPRGPAPHRPVAARSALRSPAVTPARRPAPRRPVAAGSASRVGGARALGPPAAAWWGGGPRPAVVAAPASG